MVSGLLITPPPTVMLQLMKGVWINALDVVIVALDSSNTTHVTLRPDRIKILMRNGERMLIIPDRVKDAKTHDDAQRCLEEAAACFVDHINHAALVYTGKAPHHEPTFKPSGG
jgi:hypothetical protein